MLRETILLLAAVVFCFTAVCAQDPQTWQPYKSVEGRFSVSMPCKPEVQKQAAEDGEDGAPASVYHNCFGPNGSYIVTYSDFDVLLDSKAMLDAYTEGTRSNGTLISEKPILLGRIPGREMVLATCDDGTSIIYKWHIYLSGKRMFAITAASGDPVGNAADVNKFLASFAILR